MPTIIYTLAASVPETKLQQQIGWGSASQVGTAFAWLVTALVAIAILAGLKKS